MTDRELLRECYDQLRILFNAEVPLVKALEERLAEDVDTQYEVWQADEWQAGSNSVEETMRYAHQYAEDGAVEVHEVTRRVLCKIEN